MSADSCPGTRNGIHDVDTYDPTTGRCYACRGEAMSLESVIKEKMAEAEEKAWEALSGYKFWMFGYHASRWVGLAQLLPKKPANPFKQAVDLARAKIDGETRP